MTRPTVTTHALPLDPEGMKKTTKSSLPDSFRGKKIGCVAVALLRDVSLPSLLRHGLVSSDEVTVEVTSDPQIFR